MIWLTWRQHRKQALVTGVMLAVVAAFMVPTGLAMRSAFNELGLPACAGQSGLQEGCGSAFTQFTNRFDTLLFAAILFLVLPALVGLFWGAPLVAREVEQGTHRLVWTQGVSRRHWAVVKFGSIGGAALLVSVAYGLGMSWWLGPLAQVERSRFEVLWFDMQGVVPVGYTIFAVALGIFAGTVWHKVLPAMAVTLVGFLGVRVIVAALARPRYLPAETRTSLIVGGPGGGGEEGGEWTLATGIRDASGELVVSDMEIRCPPGFEGPGGHPCGSEFGLDAGAYNWQLYHPADRFWIFQGIETGIFVALSAMLILLAVRRLRRIA